MSDSQTVTLPRSRPAPPTATDPIWRPATAPRAPVAATDTLTTRPAATAADRPSWVRFGSGSSPRSSCSWRRSWFRSGDHRVHVGGRAPRPDDRAVHVEGQSDRQQPGQLERGPDHQPRRLDRPVRGRPGPRNRRRRLRDGLRRPADADRPHVLAARSRRADRAEPGPRRRQGADPARPCTRTR